MVERLAHIVNLVRFGHGDLSDEYPAILLRADQAGLFEGPQRLADRAPAGAEARGQLAFIDALSDGEFAAQNQLFDLHLHQRRQRIRLHQLQHGGSGGLCH